MLFDSSSQGTMYASIPYFICAVCWLQLFTISTGNPCAMFEFSPLSDLQLAGKENMTVNITFNIRNLNCTIWDNLKILVSKFDKRRKVFEHVCSIRHVKGVCTPPASGLCLCLSPNKYLFTKTLHRSDNTQWKWSTDDQSVDMKIIQFNVTHPANIKHLLINEVKDQYYAKIPTTVHVVCTWENGNPPTTLRLLNANGSEIANSASGPVIHQLYVDSRCERHVFRCEANGANQNASCILLSECPPDFVSDINNITSAVGQDVSVSFLIRLHTLANMSLHVTKHSEDCHSPQNNTTDAHNHSYYKCSVHYEKNLLEDKSLQININDPLPFMTEGKCNCTLSGSVPVLDLEMQLYNVTVLDFGLWRLDVINSEGTAQSAVCIHQSQGPPEFVNHTSYFTAVVGQNASFKFPIRLTTSTTVPLQLIKNSKFCHTLQNNSSGTTNHTYSCPLHSLLNALTEPWQKNKNNTRQLTIEEKCDYTLSGTMPILTLEIKISNITVFDFGLWRLVIMNSAGTGQSSLCIQPSQGPPILDNSPSKTISTIIGGTFNVTFSMLLYSLHITACRMQKFQSIFHKIVSNTSYQCRVQNTSAEVSFSSASERPKTKSLESDLSEDKCSCSVHGTPPYLHLELVFNRVTESDRGLWRLSVSNSNGSGYVSVNVAVSAGTESNKSKQLVWIISGCALGVLAIMIILISVLKNSKNRLRNFTQDLLVMEINPLYQKFRVQKPSEFNEGNNLDDSKHQDEEDKTKKKKAHLENIQM